MVIDSIASDPRLKALAERLASQKGVVHVSGLWGSAAPMVAAMAAVAAGRTVLYITAHPEEADHAQDDIELFSSRRVTLFPAFETLPGEGPSAGEIEAERLAICSNLQTSKRSNVQTSKRPNVQMEREEPGSKAKLTPSGGAGTLRERAAAARAAKVAPPAATEPTSRPSRDRAQAPDAAADAGPPVIVAPILALMQAVPTRAVLVKNTIALVVGSRAADEAVAGPEGLLAWAMERGYERLDMIEQPGDIARRGDIVDIFPPGEERPYRIQFFDDQVEAIRRLDLDTRRSMEAVSAMSITALPRDAGYTQGVETLFAFLPEDALVILDGPGEVQEMGRTLHARIRNLTDGRRDGASGGGLFEVEDVLQAAERLAGLHLSRFGGTATGDEATYHFVTASLVRFEGGAANSIAALVEASATHEVHVFCDNEGERKRLAEMLSESTGGQPTNMRLHVGVLHRGFEWRATKTIVVAHHEVFGRQRLMRRMRRVQASGPIESWADLKTGDYVVHLQHGIGLFRGLRSMAKSEAGQSEEFLTIEFAEGATVHVPASQIELVQKYIGAGGGKPKLSVLGGKRWKKSKEQVAEAVEKLAENLLRVQAARMSHEGIAYPADTEWQREFEAAFLYEETEDQLIVGAEVRDDLMKPRPMDRLVCGDVGFGKTEMAMRAAFKIMEYGKQVAVLVPTTVLAEQHYETFCERMADYPFRIGCLSRFRSKAEQSEIIRDLRQGRIDCVIGTHRLLSKDVEFSDLGLAVIDEEQRFGVEHKERLKTLRATVDVLTLSATPIPRTLHMATAGLRDISRLSTPPVDRRSIATQVVPFDRELIKEGILREMNRDGQVFFVHNFVRSIEAMAHTIRAIVPEARVVYGHGQMSDHELEAVMHKFLHREADVLVATTIIESGIDVPSANTIFINNAERFGLADLHQLRGRVGRSKHKAYCYLLLSPDRPPRPNAVKRLKAIEEFSELGAGFRIAMRDLEIRGAGNLLGMEQSGHIAAVGYELYVRLLNRAVCGLKNEPDPEPPSVQIDLDVQAQIPTSYIVSERMRMEAYRRIASCRVPADLHQLERDLSDTYGKIPPPVMTLLDLAELRVLAGPFGIRGILRKPPDVIFQVESLAGVERVFRDPPGSVRMADEHTVHLRLPPNYLEPASLVAVVRRLLVRASEAREMATAGGRGDLESQI
jgi:transcription-repair coupling factor (superfamily II helicase)